MYCEPETKIRPGAAGTSVSRTGRSHQIGRFPLRAINACEVGPMHRD